jgi:DNA repair protein RadC
VDDVAVHDRPREKLEQVGVGALGDNELVAAVMGHGSYGRNALAVANDLLALAGGVHGLTRLHRRQFRQVSGIGPAQAARLQAAVELGRRTLMSPPAERPQFRNGRDAALFLLPRYGAHPVERFGVLLLDVKCRLITTRLLSVGSLEAAHAHPREVYREAILSSAALVIAFHNHPSGDPTPSAEDLRVTSRLREAGTIVGIELADHVILGDARYYSLQEAGFF